MATDPVQQIREHHFDTPITQDLAGALDRLAALPPSVEVPYLTLSLDWRPDGNSPGRRLGQTYFDQNVDQFLAEFAPHTPAHDSLSADLERTRAFLETAADPAAQAVFVVACAAQGAFEPLLLGFPIEDRIVTGPTPALRRLAQVAEDAPTFAVLAASQVEANLFIIVQSRRDLGLQVEASGFPRKQMQGGWSQRRYQNRADERVEAFARTVAEETRRVFDETGAVALVLAGEEQIATALTDAFHQTVRDKLVGTISLPPDADFGDILEAALPVVEQAERARELVAVETVREGAGPGGKAVTGAVETLTALQTGQVMTLVMNDDFAAPGWADFTFPVYGVGPVPAEHPAGGNAADLVPVALEEELVRLAIQFSAEIEVVKTAVPVGVAEQGDIPVSGDAAPRSPAAAALDALGGVGAVLRFTLDAAASTAQM